jgi:hypothetical protein
MGDDMANADAVVMRLGARGCQRAARAVSHIGNRRVHGVMEYRQTEIVLPCPVCGQLTDSLKQYRYVSWLVFFLVKAVGQAVVYRACPGCKNLT